MFLLSVYSSCNFNAQILNTDKRTRILFSNNKCYIALNYNSRFLILLVVESCPRLNFPEGTDVTCTDKRGNQIDCSQATIGTRLSYTCPQGYLSFTSTERTCSKDSWGEPAPSCVKRQLDEPSENGISSTTAIPEYNDDIKVICTYASWEAYNNINPEDLNPHLCTHIYYAFAGIWEKGDMRVQDDPLDLHRGKSVIINCRRHLGNNIITKTLCGV